MSVIELVSIIRIFSNQNYRKLFFFAWINFKLFFKKNYRLIVKIYAISMTWEVIRICKKKITNMIRILIRKHKNLIRIFVDLLLELIQNFIKKLNGIHLVERKNAENKTNEKILKVLLIKLQFILSLTLHE
jgi:hypothetical protein